MLKLIGKVILMVMCVLILASCAQKPTVTPSEEEITPPSIGTPTAETEEETEEEVPAETETETPTPPTGE